MLKNKKYSIWLMPDGETYERLKGLISQLSRQYSTPNFKPHTTLLGDITGPEKEMVAKTEQLASIVRPHRIDLKEANYADRYFECLFIQAAKTNETLRANLEARKIFGRQDDQQYVPHLGLMYGEFSFATKKEILDKIGRKFNIGFDVKSIYLFDTSGTPKEWYKLQEFPLSAN